MTISPVAARRLLKLTRFGLVAIAILVAVAAIDVIEDRLSVTDLDRLAQKPEASLQYPGSVLLDTGGHDTGPFSNATISRWLGSDSSPDEVLAFYDTELAARGWRAGAGGSVIMSTDETRACAWRTDQLIIRLGFMKPDVIRKRVPAWATHATVYRLLLIDQGVGASGPACMNAD